MTILNSSKPIFIFTSVNTWTHCGQPRHSSSVALFSGWKLMSAVKITPGRGPCSDMLPIGPPHTPYCPSGMSANTSLGSCDVVDVETPVSQSTSSSESRKVSRVKIFFPTIRYTQSLHLYFVCMDRWLLVSAMTKGLQPSPTNDS